MARICLGGASLPSTSPAWQVKGDQPGSGFGGIVAGACFYLIQQRSAGIGVGYGTESAPFPRVATNCDDGCPGAPPPPAGPGQGTNARK